MVVLMMIVSVAVLLASVATMSVLIQSDISQNTAQSNADLSYLNGMIGNLLAGEESCRKALGGPSLYNTLPFRNPQIYNPANLSNEITLYQSDGTTILFQGTGDPEPANPQPYQTFGHPRLTIRSISLKQPIRVLDPGVPTTYWTTLEITAFKPRGLEGASVIRRDDLRLVVQVDAAGRIMSCSSLSFLGSDRQPLPVCRPGQALYSNGNEIRCVRAICAAGEVASGYLPDGSLCCQTGGVGPCNP